MMTTKRSSYRFRTKHPATSHPTGVSGERRLRVALVVNSLQHGTYANFLGRLALGLTEGNRVETDLVCYDNDPAPSWLPAQVRVHRLGTQRASRSAPAILRYLRSEQPDVLLTHIVHLNLLGLGVSAVARLSGIWSGKVIVGHDHPAHLSHASDWRDNKWLVKAFYRFADGVVVDSPSVGEDAVQWCRIDPKRLALVPVPIDPYVRRETEPPHPWLCPGSPPVFLGTGRLVRYKRFDMLIDAFNEVQKSHDVRLLIIGTGTESEPLARQIRSLDIAGRAQLVDWVGEPREWAARATAFVLPSEEEGFGQVLTEAMSVGCPVVVTDSLGGGPRFITDNGRTGILVPRGDQAALVDAMKRMLCPEIQEHYSRLGLERVETFSPLSCATALVDFLEALF